MKKIHLIANKKSGKGAGESLPGIALELCREYGYEFIHHETGDEASFEKQIEKAADLAEQDGGIVVAAGGDGTIRAVAEKVHGRNIRFGVVSCGTFNFFARTHQLPETSDDAFKAILTGEVKEVRLGEINGRIFLINASLGLYAKAIRDREKNTSRFGRNRLVVIISTLFSILQGHRLLEVTLKAEGAQQKILTPMIFIGNNALQLRDLSMNVADCMKKDLLAAVLMKPLKVWEVFRALFYGFANKLDREDGVVSFCIDEFEIITHDKKVSTIALDGELFKMSSPLKVRSRPKALKLIKPIVIPKGAVQ
ncbi:MAG: NAD(+)/NADH kinase [Bdellovibrionaceae bacterium]|nr:NAD(+)/NADH kinase [Pseudobdellovibrionaceae bacterium]